MTIGRKYDIIYILASEFRLSETLVYPNTLVSFALLGVNGTFFISWFLPAERRLKYKSYLLQAEPAGRSQLC